MVAHCDLFMSSSPVFSFVQMACFLQMYRSHAQTVEGSAEMKGVSITAFLRLGFLILKKKKEIVGSLGFEW